MDGSETVSERDLVKVYKIKQNKILLKYRKICPLNRFDLIARELLRH